MSAKPRLKYRFAPVQVDGEVRLALPEERSLLSLEDETGQIRALLSLLDGEFDLPALLKELQRTFPLTGEAALLQAIADLDAAHLLEDAAASTTLTAAERQRYASNLYFFARHATLAVSRFTFQERLRDSHVVLLGAGGLGSVVLMNLAGMGVGHIELVDFDIVEVRNFVRQFIYRDADVGRAKVLAAVEAVRAINSHVTVVPHQKRIAVSSDVLQLLDNADLLIAAIDASNESLASINTACAQTGVPFIYGGWSSWGGIYFSVEPLEGGCLACGGFEPEHLAPIRQEGDWHNPGVGPAATLLGGLVTLEALRFLTRFTEPVSIGRVWQAEFATSEVTVCSEWTRDPHCVVCQRGFLPPAEYSAGRDSSNEKGG